MILAMKSIMTAALTLLAAMPAAAAERRYSVTDFDRVQVDGPYQVTLTTGRSSAAIASGSQQALDRVSVEVQGRTLRIRPNRSAWGGYPGDNAGPVKVQVGVRDLRAAMVTGSGSLNIDKAKGLRLDLSVSGSGTLGLADADADVLFIGLLGSGKITLGGRAKQLRATIQGTGDFDGRGLKADDVQINADTAGTIAVAAVRSAKIRATGQGDVAISGSPACTVEALGAGAVRCGDD